MPAVAIIGVGNPMRRDDGVGPAAIACLAHTDFGGADVELLTLDGEPARLIEAWRNRHRVIVVDAVRSGDPVGSVHRVDLNVDPLPGWTATRSSHGSGVAEAVALARALDALPRHLVLLGTEPGDTSLGEGLSDEVRASLSTLVERIRVEALA